jgi:HK97 family phage major capsid protein
MRRDEIRAITESRARVLAQMRELDAKATEEKRNAFSAEEQEQYDKLATEFEELGDKEQRSLALYQQEREVEKSLASPIEKRVGIEQDAGTYEDWREAKHGIRPQDEPEVRNAYWKYMHARSTAELDVEEQRALSRATGAAGNFLVPTDFYRQLISALRWQGSFASLANEIVTDNGETIPVAVNTAFGTANWVAENNAYTPSDETYAQVNLGAFKAARKIIVSEELLEDSAFDLQAHLAERFGESISVLEETAFIMGDGAGKPQGILSSATASNITTVTAAAGAGNVTTFGYDALVTAMFSLPPQYRANASWIVSDASARNLYLLKDSTGQPIWSPTVASGGPDTLLGKPVYTHPDLPTAALGNISAVFGDWRRAYTVRRVRGFSMQRQNELHSDNGQIGFRGQERVDGRVVLAAAAVALKHAAT